MTDKEKEIMINKFIKAYNEKDVKGMLKCVSDDVVFKNVSNGVTMMEVFGFSSLRELAEKTLMLFKTRKQTVKHMTYSDDVVRVDIQFEGEFGIDLPNGICAGEKISVEGYSEYKFGKDGRISYIADIS